jgi:hypothetical protein
MRISELFGKLMSNWPLAGTLPMTRMYLRRHRSWVWWLMPVILAMWEAEIPPRGCWENPRR